MFFISCDYGNLDKRENDVQLPVVPYSYNMGVDDNMPTLGRVLFYDPRLSANNTVSCASCHKQNLAFTDDKKFSLGFEGKNTLRNSMPIQNIVTNLFFGASIIDSLGFPVEAKPTSLFWDGRQQKIETMVLEPIQNHIEMGVIDLDGLAEELAQTEIYKYLFGKAFENKEINQNNLAMALSAFLVSIRADQTKFDQSMAGMTALDPTEEIGRGLFFDTYDCNSCHQLQQPFNGYQNAGTGEFGGFADIGLDESPTDLGLFKFSSSQEDKGKFKIPSLRNIMLTAPYMHDGRFETLEDVIDHYSEDIKGSTNLDVRLTENGQPKKFNIPLQDKQAIIAFLNTLTDHNMISDIRFSDPFIKH